MKVLCELAHQRGQYVITLAQNRNIAGFAQHFSCGFGCASRGEESQHSPICSRNKTAQLRMGLIRVLTRPREVARDIQNALACVIEGAADIGGPPSSPLGPFESNPPGNGGELAPEVQSRGRKEDRNSGG